MMATGCGIPERVLRRGQDRVQETERRRLEKAGQVVEGEKRDFFLATFGSEREALERLLLQGGEAPAPPLEEGATDAGLQEAGARLQALQKLLNDSLLFLPAYDVKQAQEALQRLQAALGERRLQLRPPKKFAFKTRDRKEAPAAAPLPQPLPESSGRVEVPGPTRAPDVPPPENSCVFGNLVNQTLELCGAPLRGRDVQLSALRGCRVRLLGSPGTLRLRGLSDCTLLCGPVSTSVFVDECSGCELAFACQQLRVHRSSDTRVYLHVTCRAIIEDCRSMGFAPLDWSYPGMDEDLRHAGLDPARNYWNQVDDFNWLARDAASPNWSIVPEEQRRTQWDDPTSPPSHRGAGGELGP